jgi:hypothetical protein
MAFHKLTAGLLLSGLVVAAAGCKNDDTDETDEDLTCTHEGTTYDDGDTWFATNGDDCECDAGTVDCTPPVTTYLDPWWFQMAFWFAIDQEATPTPPMLDSYAVDENLSDATPGDIQDLAAIVFMLEDDGGGLGDEVCEIFISQPGPISPESLDDGGVTVGFKFDWSLATLDHNCDGLLDPALWGSDLAVSLATVDWGVGLSAAVAGDVEDSWETLVDDWADNWDGKMTGARPFLSGIGTLHNSGDEFYFSRATAVDTSTDPYSVRFVDTDGDDIWDDDEAGQYLAAADVLAGPPTAAYFVTSPFVLNFGVTLDEIFTDIAR